jgi:hypothetical protein
MVSEVYGSRSYGGGANLQGAYYLQGAYLQGAYLQGVRGLTENQIKWTIGSDKTKLPEGFNRPDSRWTASVDVQEEELVERHIVASTERQQRRDRGDTSPVPEPRDHYRASSIPRASAHPSDLSTLRLGCLPGRSPHSLWGLRSSVWTNFLELR